MHISFLTPEYPNEKLSRSGGLGTSIKNLAINLTEENIEATVFVIGQRKSFEFKDGEVRVISIAKKKHSFFNWFIERKRIQKIITNKIKESQIDIIEAPDWTGCSAFMSFSIPLVVRMNGSDGYFCHLEGRKQKLKNRILESVALKNADFLIAASTFTGKITKELFQLKKNVTTIHNGIDTNIFKPITTSINEFQILYFGTLVRKKGVLDLAHIFNNVLEMNPKSKLLFIGKDNIDVIEKRSTKELINNLLSNKAKRNVEFLDEVPYEEVKEYVSKAHVIALPSYAEAFPMTWLETLAMGKPLVSSDIGWAKELMIDGKTGYTVNPKSHKEYADRIITIMEDQDLENKFKINGRNHVVKNFSTNISVKRNINYYKAIMSKNEA